MLAIGLILLINYTRFFKLRNCVFNSVLVKEQSVNYEMIQKQGFQKIAISFF